jgi:hypothetical protein
VTRIEALVRVLSRERGGRAGVETNRREARPLSGNGGVEVCGAGNGTAAASCCCSLSEGEEKECPGVDGCVES